MKLNYVSHLDDINLLSNLKIDNENKNIIIFSNKNKKISENIILLKNNNISKFPYEISCLINLLPKINKEDYYFIDFHRDEFLKNINLFLEIDLDNEIFKSKYFFINNNLKDDISICLANYRDKVLFSTKKNPVLPHGFPLIIEGYALIFILRFLKISFDLNIFNYNIEGIFAILLKMKYG